MESKLCKKIQTERIESDAADVIKNLEVDFLQKSVLHETQSRSCNTLVQKKQKKKTEARVLKSAIELAEECYRCRL